jgi:hypothetical protein
VKPREKLKFSLSGDGYPVAPKFSRTSAATKAARRQASNRSDNRSRSTARRKYMLERITVVGLGRNALDTRRSCVRSRAAPTRLRGRIIPSPSRLGQELHWRTTHAKHGGCKC